MGAHDHENLTAARAAVTRLSDGTCGTEFSPPDMSEAEEIDLDCSALTHNEFLSWTARMEKAAREAKRPRGLWAATTRRSVKLWINSVLRKVGISRFSFSTAREEEVIAAWGSSIMLRLHELDDEFLKASCKGISSVEEIRRSTPRGDLRLP